MGGLLLLIWALSTAIIAIKYTVKDWDEQKRFSKRLGYHTFFYFFVPGYPMFIYFIDTWSPSNKVTQNFISRIFYRFTRNYRIKRLLQLNGDILIFNVVRENENRLDYVTRDVQVVSRTKVTYRHVNDELFSLLGNIKETVVGKSADTLWENRDRQLVMKESEFKIMVINDRLETLDKIDLKKSI